MASYPFTIATAYTKIFSKCVVTANEQLLKTACPNNVNALKKKIGEKP